MIKALELERQKSPPLLSVLWLPCVPMLNHCVRAFIKNENSKRTREEPNFLFMYVLDP